MRKLDNLTQDDKCQITMISTWATELYLDKVFLHIYYCSTSQQIYYVTELISIGILQINRLLLEDDTALENRNSEYHLIIREFRAFLSDCKDVLDEATTMKLLER